MPNNLTGDFDVVAEFTLPAVNRVLAAMHQCERLLHSIAVRVNDNPLPGSKVNFPTAVGVVDAFGDAPADHQRLKNPAITASDVGSSPILTRLGMVVNPGDLVATAGTITPSNLQGVAQLQLYAPTVSIPPQSNAITVTTNVMARYFPDKNTAQLAEFIRGDVNITAPINKIASGRIHVLNVDFKAQNAIINFTPSYSSKPLSAEDIATINLCIQNGLKTSFLPSSVTLPSSVADVQLKTLPGTVAVLLNLNSHPASVGSVTNAFVGSGDDFAFAAGRDYIFAALRPIADTIISQPPMHITVTFGYHFSFEITLASASFDLLSGKIVLLIKAHATPRNHTWVGSADFTISVGFFLQPSGNTVQLGVGNVSISFDSSLTGAFAGIVDYFTGNVTDSVKSAVMNALDSANAFAIVDKMFNSDTNLAQFLNAQLAPPDGSTAASPQQISLMYTAAEIQQAGVVMRGLLLLKPWPDPYIEYEPIPTNPGDPIHTVPGEERDYSALKTWIPGGRVDQYEWSHYGQNTPFQVDANKFVLKLKSITVQPPEWTMARSAAISAFSPFCLTVRGTRVRNYGPGENPQTIVAKVCGYRHFPVFPGGLVNADTTLPLIALTHPGHAGEVVVTGHAEGHVAKGSNSTPNLLAHFTDAKSDRRLEHSIKALEALDTQEHLTAVVAVLPPGQLVKTTFVPGVTYSEDTEGSWQKLFGLKSVKVPLTVIVSPQGRVVWQKEGALDDRELTAALKQHLAMTGAVQISVPRLNARIGQPAPNFVFNFSPGREMPLSKLRGHRATLIFWKTASRASIEAVRFIHTGNKSGSTVLAVNDGDSTENASSVAAENGFSDVLMVDPQRRISTAYGVQLWPTIVSLNESGFISAIRFGFDPNAAERVPLITKRG